MSQYSCRRFFAAAFALGALLLLVPTQTHAGTLDIFVGYGDYSTPSFAFFPSPWLGDPGIVSQSPGFQGIDFDSAAIRIDNNTGGPVTISNLLVFVGLNTYTLWAPLVIQDGEKGIFTENNFDNRQFNTSDFGIFGAFPPASLAPNNFGGNGNTSLIGGCSSPAALIAAAGETNHCFASAARITFDANGTIYSVIDTGHILDTGGWDFRNNTAFGEDGNESINWNAIGAAPARDGSAVPEPSSLALLGAGISILALLRSRSSF